MQSEAKEGRLPKEAGKKKQGRKRFSPQGLQKGMHGLAESQILVL